MVKIVEKSQIWSNVSKILDFGPNCRKMLIWVKTYRNVNFSNFFAKNVDFSQNFRKNIDSCQNLQISRFWSEFSKNFNFGQKYWKSRFWWKFSGNLKFGQNFRTISILAKMVENSRFWSKLTKMSKFLSKLKEILILIQIFEECRLESKLTKLSILDKTEENVEFSKFKKKILWSFSTFPKNSILSKLSKNVGLEILILVKIVEKSEIWSKLSKKLDFGKNCRKFSILVKTYQNIEFGQN